MCSLYSHSHSHCGITLLTTCLPFFLSSSLPFFLSFFLSSSLRRQVNEQRNLNHPNVVRVIGVCLDVGKFSIVMEYAEKGSLFNVLETLRRAWDAQVRGLIGCLEVLIGCLERGTHVRGEEKCTMSRCGLLCCDTCVVIRVLCCDVCGGSLAASCSLLQHKLTHILCLFINPFIK